MKPHKFSISEILTRSPKGQEQDQELNHGKCIIVIAVTTVIFLSKFITKKRLKQNDTIQPFTRLTTSLNIFAKVADERSDRMY